MFEAWEKISRGQLLAGLTCAQHIFSGWKSHGGGCDRANAQRSGFLQEISAGFLRHIFIPPKRTRLYLQEPGS
jgi:hypothetical protein